jgi:acyl transferase domain-containing protein
MLTSLGRLWLLGLEPDWDGFYSSEKRRRVALPTYPFERKSYWIDPPKQCKDLPSLNGFHSEVGRDGTGVREPGAVQGGGSLPPAPAAVFQSTDLLPPIPEERGSNARRLIERQVQVMTQQLEMLRRCGAADGSNDARQ